MTYSLNECPFCGGRVRYNHNIDLEPDGIWCPTCHMLVKFTRISVHGNESFDVAMEKMAKVWNRRADD